MPTIDTNDVGDDIGATSGSVSLVHPGGVNNAIVGVLTGYDMSGGAPTWTWSGTDSPDLTFYDGGGGDGVAVGIWVNKAAETANVAYSGGPDDSGLIAFSATLVDQSTPADGFVAQAPGAATPDDIDVTSTADGEVIGVIQPSNNPTPDDTQIHELNDMFQSGEYMNVQHAPGTGGTVTMGWTAGGTTWSIGGFNLRHQGVSLLYRWRIPGAILAR